MRRTGIIAASRKVPSYSVTPNITSVNEGASVTFTVNSENVPDGSVIYWTTQPISGVVNAADFGDNKLQDVAEIFNNEATIVRPIAADNLTEGPESFRLIIRTIDFNGPIVATSATVTIIDTSTTPPSYSITPSPTTVNEGQTVTFTVNTTEVPDNTTLFWTTVQIQGTITTGDFTDNSLSGSVTINGNTGSISRGIRNDNLTEGTERFRLDLRTGSTGGPVVASSATVTINDTSLTPDPPPQPVTTTQTFGPFDAQNHWTARSGNNQEGSSDHIQGTFDGTAFNRRGTLIFFPSSIRNTLQGASIGKVEVFVRRVNSAHGVSGSATVRVHTHSQATPINSWTGTGLTQRGTLSLGRGAGDWVDVGTAVGNGIRDGSINGLGIYTNSNNIGEYARLVRGDTRIRITYTK